MRLAFLLHLYQPSTQDEETLRLIATTSYIPLVKKIKSTKNLRLSLDIPLSLLEQMDKHGYKAWIDDVKDLVTAGRVELTGSGAYHPLLPKLPTAFVEKQVILNEYALGYYFGSKIGFEGEPAITVKNLAGFFPPELAVSDSLMYTLAELGYKWVAVNEFAVPASMQYSVILHSGCSVRLVCRNAGLSNLLSFKRNLVTDDFMNMLSACGDSVIVMDGEFFGHHYKDGIVLFDKLLDEFAQNGVELTTVAYPLWENKENPVLSALWELYNTVLKEYAPQPAATDNDKLGNCALWNTNVVTELVGDVISHKVSTDFLVMRVLYSDQFWWLSKEFVFDKMLNNPYEARKAIVMYEEIIKSINSEDISLAVEKTKRLLKV
ncbi:MAG: hypothetical protein UX69_C0012G0002 [candidate division WWE3 bacterium GW2011_GWA2_46_9]|uniref:Glycoside hydrolase family 57 N-terminal domain-containing protein n=1 Tax=candidate division WWE3 bacterium GW2011_GWA2_46_9 TaxID=1619111 RepID=A0A0G1TTK7_UNCKA|nr:MAG: hypothetical protein UX69_C0012G0002 [candidate division WWE3 bacterium GW2011_GWA2_46_9]